MDPLASERLVIDAARRRAASLGADPTHTVAAAVMDIDGRIYEAVNVFHFTGGPCAELVALGVAATQGAGPLLSIAAAGDEGRGVIAPCGRCRQVLLDQHPDILVAVPSPDGPIMRAMSELLPDAYRRQDTLRPRILRFHARYFDAVASGAKTETLRWNEDVPLGPTTLMFEDHPAYAHREGEVTAVTRTLFGSLDAATAESLRGHYPAITDDAVVTRVTFRVLP